MSRIGKKPISLPDQVKVSLDGTALTVAGPKGTLHWVLPVGISLRIEDSKVMVNRQYNEAQDRAFHGLTRALLANMVTGVSQGYSKQLKIVGVGYRAEVTGTGLKLALGYSHPIDITAPPGISFTVDKNVITVAGIDKQLVGQTAAQIRALKKPEPYKGKGIMYVDETIRRKPGKAAKAVGTGIPGGTV